VRAFLRFVGIVVTLAVVVVLAGVGWLWYAIYRDRAFPAQSTQIVIERGATFGDITRELAEQGVIGNALSFRLLAKLRHSDVDVRAGEYKFDAHQTQNEVLRALLTGGAQVAVWVTIPEGFTAKQIARRLADAGLGSEDAYATAFAHDSLDLGGVRTAGLEGYLFPSTYLMPLGASPEQIESQMNGEFLKKLPPDAGGRARVLGVTLPQAVTVASLIEREAKADSDRPLIASVIYNRLRLGMPLQVDATIEYALPEHKSALSFADLKIDSPYNSYLHPGLPPTPIANPGQPSLEAALHPSKSGYLYYVYCGNGHHVFANTLEAHQANVARCL
jgi:UPF0755 protein